MNARSRLAGLLLAGTMSIAMIGAGEGAAYAGARPSIVPTATGARTAPAALSEATTAAAPLLFDINGSWTDFGSARPVISTSNRTILVDMSFAHRPNATGIVVNASTISVRFPDDATYTGRLQAPNIIRWSNGSTWTKVYTGPMLFNLSGEWSDGVVLPSISQVNGFLEVSMLFANHRPTARGFALNASTIRVTFPDDATYIGTLQAPFVIRWSNGTSWHSVPIL